MKKELGITVILVALFIVVSILNPRFLSPMNLQNVSNLVGIFGIFSIGMGIVIITGGIDLSVGSAFALQGVFLSFAMIQWHWPWPLAVLASILLLIGLGLFHGVSVTMFQLQPFIVTLCGLLVYRSQARFFAHEETQGFISESGRTLHAFATRVFHIGNMGIPMPFVALLVIGFIMWLVLHRSVYGRYLFAVGKNEEAARYSGINTKLVICSAYALSMLLAGISGIFLAFYTYSVSPTDHGTWYELYAIAAAVLGGCSLRGGEGSILGIVLGTILLQVLRNMVVLLGIHSSLELTVMGVVIYIGVLTDQLLRNRKRKSKLARVEPGFEVVQPKSGTKAG